MNHKQRIEAVLSGGTPDHAPVGFSSHFPPECARGEEGVRAHLDYFHQTGNDFCKIMNENQLRGVCRLEKAGDFSRVSINGDSRLGIAAEAELVSRIVDGLKGDAHALVTIHGPLASVHHMSGRDGFFVENREFYARSAREDPAAFKSALTAAADSLCEMTRHCLDAGADGIYFAALGAHNDLFTDEEYAEWVRPFDLQVLKEAGGARGFNILHACHVNLAVRRFTDYPVDVVNWEFGGQNPTLEEGLALFDPSYTIMGGLDNHAGSIINGTEAEIEKDIHDVLRTVEGRRFILGAGCTLPTGLDAARIRAAVRSCERFQAAEVGQPRRRGSAESICEKPSQGQKARA